MLLQEKLFPEFLPKGSKGPAVALLQALLLTQDFNAAITVDGDYGGETAKGVEELQKFLNAEGVWRDDELEVDGDFGPATRKAYMLYFNLDVNALPASLFVGVTEAAGS